jgi:hypothetical protein
MSVMIKCVGLECAVNPNIYTLLWWITCFLNQSWNTVVYTVEIPYTV